MSAERPAAGTAGGDEMLALVRRLYPICRSITGDGVRSTLAALAETLPLEVHEVPSGTEVFDWSVPKEWNVRDAWIRDPSGAKIVDFAASNLHLLSYSVPIHRTMPLAELRPHLHTLPESPDWIPYRTSYYKETWGFCLPHRQLESLADGDYEVFVDTTLEPGHLSYGECFLPGEEEGEVLVSCHVCHPSLANDNLSAIAVCSALAAWLAARPRRWGYRFLFLPGTIGAITWLALNRDAARRIRAGLVAANLGDGGGFHYKRSRRGDSLIDRAAVLALRDAAPAATIEDFVPFGYDERQYCSPGFDLPVGSLTRTPWGRYPEYHTSADNPDLLTGAALAGSLELYRRVVAVLEGDERYRSRNPHCEPQLGKRGLYGSLGGSDKGRERELALLWVLNQADGEHSLIDVAERSGLGFAALREAADRLLEAELIEPAG